MFLGLQLLHYSQLFTFLDFSFFLLYSSLLLTFLLIFILSSVPFIFCQTFLDSTIRLHSTPHFPLNSYSLLLFFFFYIFIYLFIFILFSIPFILGQTFLAVQSLADILINSLCLETHHLKFAPINHHSSAQPPLHNRILNTAHSSTTEHLTQPPAPPQNT